MQQVTIQVHDTELPLLLQFLRTLSFVKINGQKPPAANEMSQFARLKTALDSLAQPLFLEIEDPLAWQKQLRDEWS